MNRSVTLAWLIDAAMISAVLVLLKPHYGAWAFLAAFVTGLYGYWNYSQGVKAWMRKL